MDSVAPSDENGTLTASVDHEGRYMLKKFASIKNVGVFRNSPASGDTELRKLTLVHGDNGRGKTTLCAILRSLRTSTALSVKGR